jgi:peptidoglycan/LPS O-acetylase OafA/YrhL
MTGVRGIPSMTGIRGCAALWVMLFHAHQNADRFYNWPLLQRNWFLGNGWQGVDLFFMLSGFILMYAHGLDFCKISKGPLIRFARLRFTRVYPLNAVVLFLVAILVALQPGFVAWLRSANNPSDCSLGAFVRTLFLATRWFLPGQGDWNGPVWSLSLEVLAYVMFPFLAFCALRAARKWQFIGIAFLSLAGSIVILRARHYAYDDTGQVAIVRMAACFVTGIAILRLAALSAESASKWAGWMTAISAAGILVAGSLPGGGILLNFFFAVLLYGLTFQRGVINKMLSGRVAVFLGEISFPLYLVHFMPLTWIKYEVLTNGAVYSAEWRHIALLCWFIGSLMLASILHYFVEKPVHALGRRWAGARVPSPTALARS